MDVAKEKLNGKVKTVTILWDVMGKAVVCLWHYENLHIQAIV